MIHIAYCGSCCFTDGLIYTSLPPKIKCILDGELHYQDSQCTCEKKRNEVYASNYIPATVEEKMGVSTPNWINYIPISIQKYDL